MKRYIIIILFLSSITAFSQIEKIWDKEFENTAILDVEFFNDTSYVMFYRDSANYSIKVNHLFTDETIDHNIIDNIQYHRYVENIEVSEDKDKVFFCDLYNIYIHDKNFNLIDTINTYDSTKYKNIKFSVDFERNNIALVQNRASVALQIQRLVIYNLDTKDILLNKQGRYYFLDVNYSPDYNWLAVSNYDSNNTVTLINSETFEENQAVKFNSEYTHEEDLEYVKPSSDSKYLSVNHSLEEENELVTYNIDTKKLTEIENIFTPYDTLSKGSILTEDYLITMGINKNSKQEINFYSYPETNLVASLTGGLGIFDYKYDLNNKLLLSYTYNLISLIGINSDFTNIENYNTQNKSKVIPNPAIDRATINVEIKDTRTYSYYLVDQLGKTIKKFPPKLLETGMNTIELDLSSITNGIYYLKFEPEISHRVKILKMN